MNDFDNISVTVDIPGFIDAENEEYEERVFTLSGKEITNDESPE